MEQEDFEQLAQEAFDGLPEELQDRVENLHIVVEDVPGEEVVRRMKLSSREALLGLYEGVPLTHRGVHYGMWPVVPDKITLYKRNIEREARTVGAIRLKIREVLIHEIAHHYGMNEDQIRKAGF